MINPLTTTKFMVGCRQSSLHGTTLGWAVNTRSQTFETLDQCKAYIAGLMDSYRDRGVTIAEDEFVAVEQTTTFHP